ncbi:hypothetical protein GNT71_09850 [Salmonella enterica]|uniref:Phage protein n=1 Tax=Salmonella enterica TaxID=28901 RepID=A0A7U5YQK2_SALER|nr:hypothetical protein [Salmonella enterica]AXD71550.1 hypothetical protein CHC34_11665 [Salmonella enterica]EAU4681617.1 hypothetical protein [Salmonella enterica]EEB1956353.1 hypothetical protein [Salmonella enterica]EEG5587177.1 hypothetical protein [Salmonella enterica]EGS7662314.1 hypothetical protein [Salmonella enterica]
MPYDYSRLKNRGAALIKKYGYSLSLVRPAKSGIDPATGDRLSDAEQQIFSVNGIDQQYKQSEVDGTLIQTDDKKILLTAETAPEQGDYLTDGLSRWDIITITPVKPANDVLLYSLQVRLGGQNGVRG